MEIEELRNFLAVAQEENITRAAEYLHLTQPTLSRQMQALEAKFGKQLLIRGKRRVTLTQDGILFRKRAAEIIAMSEEKKDIDKVTLPGETINKYFPKSYTPKQKQDITTI